MKQNIERQPNGGEYFFISHRTLKPVLTRDWYFFTDNEKWKKNNYFLTREKAYECSAEIYEQYGEKMETVDYKKEQLDRALIQFVRNIPGKYKLGKSGQDSNTAIFDLLDTLDEYEERNKQLSDDRRFIRERIDMIIRNYPKQ